MSEVFLGSLTLSVFLLWAISAGGLKKICRNRQKRYEYRVGVSGMVLADMQRWGLEGWQFVGQIDNSGYAQFIFMREVLGDD